ncbi:MAG: hypothetical protein ACREFO_00395, partial [Acetobacteraceae bacterium]
MARAQGRKTGHALSRRADPRHSAGVSSIGIDLGTSGIKAVVLDAAGNVQAEATAPLALRHP